MKEQLDRIEAKLDKVIKAMQEYDGVDEDFKEPEEEYAWKGIGSTEAETNRRMDIIGQNGNEGLHYDKEKVVKAAKEFGKKKAKEVKEQLKGATFNIIPDFQHTPPPPKPKRKYYHNKKKK